MLESQNLIPLAAVAVTSLLYWLGWRRRLRPAIGPDLRIRRLRAAAFAAAMAVFLVALVALDGAADRGFWPHMVQHVLLLTAAAPLLVLAEPWSMLWRPLPLAFRRASAGWVARAPGGRALRALVRPLGRPAPALVAAIVSLCAWHVPAAYDLALRYQGVHDLEHLTMLAGAILFWEQVIDSAPLRPALQPVARVLYVSAMAVAGWALAAVIAYWPSPLYGHYVHSGHRPGGVSALADQQIAAGIMWGPGSIAYSVAVFWLIYVWVGDDGRGRRRRRTAMAQTAFRRERDDGARRHPQPCDDRDGGADAGAAAGIAGGRARVGLVAAAAAAVTPGRRLGVAICLALLAGAGGVAWAAIGPGGASTAGLRGDAVWRPGDQAAPAFALPDQRGRRVSTASLRGRPWLLVFLDSRCHTLCPIAGRQLGDAERRLGALPARLVVVSVDPADTPGSVRRAARRWGWRGDAWSWLMGSTARLRPVWRAYHIAVQPAAGDISHTIATYLVDASGNERAAFLPPIAVGELVGDVDALRSAGGA